MARYVVKYEGAEVVITADEFHVANETVIFSATDNNRQMPVALVPMAKLLSVVREDHLERK